MGWRCLLAVVAMASSFSPVARAEDDCSGKTPVVLAGTVSDIGTVQQEPAETPQTNFVLVLSKPWCGQKRVIVTLPPFAHCADGGTITMLGDYFPPADVKVALFRARRVLSCTLG